jgi:cytochrome c biogenesis protein CcdA
MHCPKCGQQQVSDDIRFCSRCGLPLADIATVVANEGVIPGRVSGKSSARTRGLKHGLFLLLLSLLVVPIAAIITIANDARPYVAAAAFFLTIIGGLLRMAYALLFESGESGSSTLEDNVLSGTGNVLKRRQQKKAKLNPAPAATEAYAAPERSTWMDTNELISQPSSVTDNTTKLLHEEETENRKSHA